MKTLAACAGALSCLLSTVSVQAAPTQVDVLVVYTPGVAARYGGNPTTRFNQLMSVSNQIYKDSGVNLELRMVGSTQVSYPETGDAEIALNDITYKRKAAFNNVETLRQQYGADMVVFYRPYSDTHNSCGIAWVGGYNTNGNFGGASEKSMAYAHVASDTCGDYVTVHELGHNMGLQHSRRQDGRGGTFPYALGYGEYGKFTTIMAYQSAFNVDYVNGKIWKFSNPNLKCSGNSPCGISRTDATNGADAVYTLNIVAPQVANYYPSKVAGSTTTGTTTPTSNPVLDDLRKQLASAQQQEAAAVKTLTTAQNALKAKQSQITAAQNNYNNAVNAANSAYNAVNQAVTNYNRAAMTATSNSASMQTLYNNYLRAVQEYNTKVAAAQAAANTLNAFKPLVDAVNTATVALNTVRSQISQLQSKIAQASKQTSKVV